MEIFSCFIGPLITFAVYLALLAFYCCSETLITFVQFIKQKIDAIARKKRFFDFVTHMPISVYIVTFLIMTVFCTYKLSTNMITVIPCGSASEQHVSYEPIQHSYNTQIVVVESGICTGAPRGTILF